MQGDLSVIADRLRRQLCMQAEGADVGAFLSHMDESGAWPDIDYASGSRSAWPALEHLVRLRTMAAAAVRIGEAAQKRCESGQIASEQAKGVGRHADEASLCTMDADLARSNAYDAMAVQRAVRRGVHFWFLHDFYNDNWWYNELGVMQQLRAIALFMGDMLVPDELEKIIKRLQTQIEPKWTGTNRMWFAENLVYRGVLTGDAALVLRGIHEIEATIFVVNDDTVDEGIQPDWSYAQHGLQLYSNGYGRSYLLCIIWWLSVTEHTFAAFSSSSIQTITRLVLRGVGRMCRFSHVDFSTRSREIVRDYQKDSGATMQAYLPVLSILADMHEGSPEGEKLRALSSHIRGLRTDPGFTGNTLYWRTDFMTQITKSYYASCRMLSRGVLGGDVCGGQCVNGENVLDGFGAYGLSVYMVHGAEYEKIFPVFHWGRLPGVTCPPVELPLEEGCHVDSEFAGGVSDGCNGACAMAFDKTIHMDKTAFSFGAKKAVFYLGDVVLHLGTGIWSTGVLPLQTTLNQCLLRTPVEADGRVVARESPCVLTATRLWHDSIGYVFDAAQPVYLSFGPQTGSWSRISLSDVIPETEVTRDVFCACLSHGTNASDASYCYFVLPGADPQKLAHFSWQERLSFCNTDAVQAVYDRTEDAFLAVFYQAADVCLNGMKLSASQPCFALLRDGRLWVSSPVVRGGSIVLVLNSGLHTVRYRAVMPTSRVHAGMPVLAERETF